MSVLARAVHSTPQMRLINLAMFGSAGECRRVIAGGIDPNDSASVYTNLLCHAVLSNTVEVIQALLEMGACPRRHGSGCLTKAVLRGREDLCHLLHYHGADPSENTDVLPLAIRYGNLALARWLIDNGASTAYVWPWAVAYFESFADESDVQRALFLHRAVAAPITFAQLAERAAQRGDTAIANGAAAAGARNVVAQRLTSRQSGMRPWRPATCPRTAANF